jgi:hypothetical protein
VWRVAPNDAKWSVHDREALLHAVQLLAFDLERSLEEDRKEQQDA